MKRRLDVRITEDGLVSSRQKANALIMSGAVYVNESNAVKPGMLVDDDAAIVIKNNNQKFLSRGGLKLEKALVEFQIELKDSIVADIGASTGGFSDCMLKNGAKKVFAVDVGYGQLAWELRKDNRVIVLERTNARYLSEEEIPEKLDFATVDVSFISLRLIIPPLIKLLKDKAGLVCLIKPQFEAGKEKVGKNGVVKDSGVHQEVIEKIIDFSKDSGMKVEGVTFSPIKGPKGNIEYLIYCTKDVTESKEIDVMKIVSLAHSSLLN